MNIWASATERIAQTETDADLEFLLSIISQNNSIPVLVADSTFHIQEFRNFSLPDKEDRDKSLFDELSPRNKKYLTARLKKIGGDTPLSVMSETDPHFIRVEIYANTYQYIYYEDSILLRRLSLYPYIQLVVLLIIVLVLYSAVVYTKRAEQNRVWVGLSKETAHQLGTPISSLMAWMDYLRTIAPEAESAVTEMEKDVERLAAIASRFSKIGSSPGLEEGSVGEVMLRSAAYMRNRVSGKVVWTVSDLSAGAVVRMCAPLLEWVMENLIKNAVDAMSGEGSLTLVCAASSTHVSIEITDTGRGIARRDFKRIFQPGFTTRKRGWGLGLTLARRIVETYHHGRIYVRASEPGKGTTFRIDFPLKDQTHTD